MPWAGGHDESPLPHGKLVLEPFPADGIQLLVRSHMIGVASRESPRQTKPFPAQLNRDPAARRIRRTDEDIRSTEVGLQVLRVASWKAGGTAGPEEIERRLLGVVIPVHGNSQS